MVLPAVRRAQIFVASAAVADQRPEKAAPQKVKKQEGPETVVLVRTPDILASAAAAAPGARRPLFVGFAAETERVLENAREKLARKGIDLVAANDVTEQGSGFGAKTNRLTLIDRTGKTHELASQSKDDAADGLLDRAVALYRELGLER